MSGWRWSTIWVLVAACGGSDVGSSEARARAARDPDPAPLARSERPTCEYPVHRVAAGGPVTLDASALTDPRHEPVESELVATYRVMDLATAEEACASATPADVIEEAMIVFRDDTASLPAEVLREGRTVIVRLRIPKYSAFVLLEPTSDPGGVTTVPLRSDLWIGQ